MSHDEKHSLHRRLHDCLGEIVCTNVSCDKDRFSAGSPDLLHDRGSLLCIDTSVYKSTTTVMQSSEATRAYSLTTTFAPSLANSNAALLPMPCLAGREVIEHWRQRFRINSPDRRLGFQHGLVPLVCRQGVGNAPVMMATSPAKRPRP